MERPIAVVLSALVLANFVSGCPKMVTRGEWKARNTTTKDRQINPATHVVIHHSASRPCSTKKACSSLIRQFQSLHMDANGWDDIGYNFLIGGDGLVYEGRGWNKTGAHAPGYNSKSVGICFIGTFISNLPTVAALQSAKKLINCGVDMFEIESDYVLLGHRQAVSTECPGSILYQHIKKWSHWSSRP